MWSKAEFSAWLPQALMLYDPSELILICWFGAHAHAVFFVIFFFLLFFLPLFFLKLNVAIYLVFI